MKTKSLTLVAVLALGLATGGCEQVKKLVGGGKPSGQVVATVNGNEITSIQLRQEMGNFSSKDPAVMKAAQQQALQQIILRRVIVNTAQEQKLDKSAEYDMQLRRGEENLLVQSYQRKVGMAVAVPSRQEAENYISANQGKFTGRRILVVDQVIVGPNNISPERLKALNTLGEVKALYDAEGIAYQTNVATLDTLSIDPRMIDAVDKLPEGEVFVIPQRGSVLFNRVISTHAVPFRGDPAIAYAVNQLRNQRGQEAVVRQVELLRKGAESSIVYNDAFKPPTPKKAPAAKAGTAAPMPAPVVPAAPAKP